jgi:dihydrodipicolinate synthase/N-acetylneuraminate lyase
MPEQRPIRGAVPVLVMPFDDDGAIDDDSLRRELDFCLEAGAQAICFGMGSESSMLTDAERAHVWSLAARHLDGAVPLVAATAHASREGTIALTRLARDSGVDCAMVNPQPGFPPAPLVRAGGSGGDQFVALFRDLSARVGLPLMIQDAGGNAPAEVILRAAREAEQVVSAKLESPGAPLKIGQVVAGLRASGHLAEGGSAVPGETGAAQEPARRVTVLGGANGNLLPEELEHGAVGTMPHPGIIDAFRRVCDQYAAGDAPGGRETYLRLVAPLLRAVAIVGQGDGGGAMLWAQKALLQRAGVIRTTRCRAPTGPLPDAVMDRVYRYVDGAGLLASRWRQRR